MDFGGGGGGSLSTFFSFLKVHKLSIAFLEVFFLEYLFSQSFLDLC
jgi:hypothetical protein